MSALHVAAHYGQIEIVREMLTQVHATIKSHAPTASDAVADVSGKYMGIMHIYRTYFMHHDYLFSVIRLVQICFRIKGKRSTKN